MRKMSFVAAMCAILSLGAALASEKLDDFKVKALDLIEKTRPALDSPAFKALQQQFKERGVAAKFLLEGAFTAKFLNPKDKKEYFLTAVPIASNFPTAAPPLAAVILSNGEEFRVATLKVSPGRDRTLVCRLVTTGGETVAKVETMETLREPPLPVPRSEAAIAIAKNPQGDQRILVLCRSPYAAKKEGELECLAVVFFSGDLAWEKFAPAAEAKGE